MPLATNSLSLNQIGRYARFTLGYSCTAIWAVAVLFSQMFGNTSTSFTVAFSMFPGFITCIVFIVLFQRIPAFRGRTFLVTLSALVMSLGTVGITFPGIPVGIPKDTLRLLGVIASGFTTLIVVMAWFDVWARMRARQIIVMGGFSLLISSVVCWMVLSGSFSQISAAVIVSVLPVISLICLPSSRDALFASTHDVRYESGERTLSAVLRVAIPLRTLLGFGITFFIVGSIGAISTQAQPLGAFIDPISLAYPFVLSAIFIVSAYFVRGQLDPAILYKMILSLFAGLAFLLSFSVGANSSIVFYTVLIAEVMMWMVLALWAAKTPVAHYLVFAIGWISECSGNIAGHLFGIALADNLMWYFAITLVLVLVAIGFAFSEGKFLIDVDFGGMTEDDAKNPLNTSFVPDHSQGEVTNTPRGGAEAEEPLSSGSLTNVITRVATPTLQAYIDEFVQHYDLSPREADVFAEWVTGHGLKYIQDALFISESTVKTHLRNIYRKCDTHSRDELIALFERVTNLRA